MNRKIRVNCKTCNCVEFVDYDTDSKNSYIEALLTLSKIEEKHNHYTKDK